MDESGHQEDDDLDFKMAESKDNLVQDNNKEKSKDLIDCIWF